MVGRVRRFLLTVGWLCALVGAGLMVLYVFPEFQLSYRVTALAASFIPYGILAWTMAAVLFGSAGKGGMKVLALVAAGCLLVQVVWARPYWPGRHSAPADGSLTVLTMNLRCDEPALEGLASVVERERPDVVVLQDLSQQGWDQLQGTSWGHHLPHHSTLPKDQPGAAGSNPCGPVVFSTVPVTASTLDIRQPVFTVDLPSGPLAVAPVSLPTPARGVEEWLQGFDALDEAVAAHNASAGAAAPMLVIGDFNATREHLPMRQLMARRQLVDAAEQAVAGWLPTFPADRRYPPLIAIDHVLMSPSLRASEVMAFSVKYGAHRGLVAHLSRA